MTHPRRGRALILAMSALVLMLPARASAHLRLVRSEPASGASLSDTPASFRLAFSLRPELALSWLTVISAAGDTVGITALDYDPADEKILVALSRGPMANGRYVVKWRAASADGHPITGGYEFTVAAAASVRPGDSAIAADEHAGHDMTGATAGAQNTTAPPPVEPPLIPVSLLPVFAAGARALGFAALFGLLGAASFRFTVLPRLWKWQNGKRGAAALWRARGVALGACGVFIIAHVARLILEGTMLLSGSSGRVSPTVLAGALAGTSWGISWIAGLAGFVLALVALAGTGGTPRFGWHGAAAGGILIALASALAGHAASASNSLFVASVTAVHVLAAAGWLGTLLLVVVAGIPAAVFDGRGDAPHQGVSELMAAFSPVALVSAGVMTLTGAVNAYEHLTSWTDFLHTAYGNTLLLKLVLLAVTGVLGVFHWRVAVPRLGDERGTTAITRSARTELLFGALILAVSAVLVVTPLPGE